MDKKLDLVVAMPPLEAKQVLMSLDVTYGVGYNSCRKISGMKLDFIDVRRLISMPGPGERCT